MAFMNLQDFSEDIGKLPVVDAVKSGSNAYCIDTGEVYMYEKSSNSWFKQPSNGTNETVVQSLSVTENGSYNAGTGKAYNPVTVNVPEKTVTPLEVTANGTYDAGNNAAYNPIVVNIPQEGGGGGMPKDYWKQKRISASTFACMFASDKLMSTISSEGGGISETIDDYVYLTSTDFSFYASVYSDVIITFADGTAKEVTFA